MGDQLEQMDYQLLHGQAQLEKLLAQRAKLASSNTDEARAQA